MAKIKVEVTRLMRDRKTRMLYLAIGISAVVIYEIARAYYRPYVYTHKIDDFGVAGTLGNSLGTVATVFVLLAIFGRGGAHDYFVMRAVTISVVVYELLHPLLGKSIDVLDIIATIVSGAFCEIVYRLLHPERPIMQKK